MALLPVTFALEPAFKEQFATFLAAGFSPFTAAIRIWPTDPGLASSVAVQWEHDPYVEAYITKLEEEKNSKNKPSTKDAQIKRIETRLDNLSDDNYIKAERLLAEMQGYIEKAAPASVVVDNRQTVERVLVLRDYGSDDEWEAKATAQQSKLIEHNA